MLDLRPNCVLQLKLNDNLANQTVIDSSEQSQTAISYFNTSDMHVASGNPPNLNGAFDFNGNGYHRVTVVDVPALRLTDTFTIALWLCAVDDPQTSDYEFVILKTNGTINYAFTWSADGGRDQAWSFERGLEVNICRYTTPLVKETWYFLLLTFDVNVNGGTMKAYLNGQLETTTPDCGTPDTAETDLYIGSDGNYVSDFDGLLDNVMIFDKVLSKKEILFLYNDGAGTEDLTLEPVGPMGKAQRNLQQLIAESSTFQDAIGATGTTIEKINAARARLHLTAYGPADQTFDRPFGLIAHAGNDFRHEIATETFLTGGDLELRFEREIPELYQDNDDEAEMDFKNFYEAVMADALDLSVQAGYFAINSYEIIEGPAQYQDTVSEKNICGVRLLVNWGLGG